jgi:hypothetical protein
MKNGYQWSCFLKRGSITKIVNHMQQHTLAVCATRSRSNMQRHITILQFYNSVLAGNYGEMVKASLEADEAESDMLTEGMDVDKTEGQRFALIEDPIGNKPVAVTANGQGINRLSECLMDSFSARADILRWVKQAWDKEVMIWFPVGTRVVVCGLKSTKWNGTVAVVEHSIDCAPGRVAVRREQRGHGPTRLSINPMHLVLCD